MGENARIKAGEMPEGWEKRPAKRSQKDTDARWTKKHGKSHYGYKNHVNVDRRHKLVRRYQVTDAAVHESQVLDDILDTDNTTKVDEVTFSPGFAINDNWLVLAEVRRNLDTETTVLAFESLVTF